MNAVQKQNQNAFKSMLEACSDRLASVLPKHITADRMIRTALVAANTNPAILNCTQESVISCLLKAGSLGLAVDGTIGSAYLVPYKSKCELIIGYRGLIDLARRSGQISTIGAHLVHANDTFSVRYGTDPDITHEPLLFGERGEVIGAYAVAKLTDGSTQAEFMTVGQIEDIRKRSKAGNNGPWKTDWGEMARKTVVRRLSKYLPLSAEIQTQLQSDDEVAGIIDVNVTAPPPPAIEEGQADAFDEEALEEELAAISAALDEAEEPGDLRPLIDRIKALPKENREAYQAAYVTRKAELAAAMKDEEGEG